jgi:hypothetical protein
VETFLDVRLCRDRVKCVRDALAPHSLVLIGAQKGFWLSRAEKSLAKQLRRDGHEVTLVNSAKRRGIVSCSEVSRKRSRTLQALESRVSRSACPQDPA